VIVASFLQPLENVVLWLLHRFHDNVGLPWAWAIVATTIVVRIILVPLTVRQIHSMQAMQKHAPEMKEIQKKYKGDRAKLNEELMKFYKENHINPAASCLPLVAQLPVFFSLYLVLKHFTKHVPAGSNLSWLHVVPNIAAKADSHWSGYVLLAIYASSQVLSTYFMSATMDKMQRRLMMVVPLVFITVIARFPAGLVLYWVTTNLWTVGQGVVTRRLVPKGAPQSLPSFGRKKPAAVAASSGNGAAKKEIAPPKPKPAAPARPAQPRRVKRSKGGPRR
jgi:YidC/Oxa1 family membrane protein insertase